MLSILLQELGLYYDGNSGCYYSYNQQDNKLEFHSRVYAEASAETKANEQVKKPLQTAEFLCHNSMILVHIFHQQVSTIDNLMRQFSQLDLARSRAHALGNVYTSECAMKARLSFSFYRLRLHHHHAI